MRRRLRDSGNVGFNPKQIKAAMPDMLDLAKASGVGLDQTADIASNILSAFKMEAAQMGRVSDTLALTMTTSNVDLNMLAETMKYMGPIANKAGMSLGETKGRRRWLCWGTSVFKGQTRVPPYAPC